MGTCSGFTERAAMFYITGDTHGDFNFYKAFVKRYHPKKTDVMIILGDAVLNYFDDEHDDKRKYFVNSFPFKTFCIHGNHDLRPEHVKGYKLVPFYGGRAWHDPKFQNIFFAKDSEIYSFENKKCIVIGGAYSIDKDTRIDCGYRWFEDEQPSDEIKKNVESRLEAFNYNIDIVLSHTCPLKYMPVEAFLQNRDQLNVDRSTEQWLDAIEDRLKYKAWYCGHFHIDKKIDKICFLYNDITIL